MLIKAGDTVPIQPARRHYKRVQINEQNCTAAITLLVTDLKDFALNDWLCTYKLESVG